MTEEYGRIKAVHVINKKGTGGIESLVSCLVSNHYNDKIFHHESFQIADSKLSQKLFSRRLVRKTVYFSALVRLIKNIIKSRHNDFQETIYFFHHAESHRLLLRLSKFVSRSTRMLVYIHQSPKNFPKPLIKSTLRAIVGSEKTIFYSKTIEDVWKASYPMLHEANTVTIQNFVCQDRIKIMGSVQKNERYLICLYLGRNVQWKQPHLAIEWAASIARRELCVKLIFAGIEPTSSTAILNQTKCKIDDNFLKIEFIGVVKEVSSLIQGADILFVPANQFMTPEVIGIAALEALSIGLPVFVAQKGSTNYETQGVYPIQDLVSFSRENSISQIRSRFALNKSQIDKWREHNSRRRYEEDLWSSVSSRKKA